VSDILFSFKDRVILDNGLVVFTDQGLIQLARDGVSLNNLKAITSPEVEKFNLFSEEQIDTNLVTDTSDWYKWNTPEPFCSIDVPAYLRALTSDAPYSERLEIELGHFETRNMFPLVRHVIYLIDYMKKNDMIWGVGRGSSSASLIFYLIGLHRIDPILYDIPLNEFIKDI
jgi:DNA polymerase III alpha subunit